MHDSILDRIEHGSTSLKRVESVADIKAVLASGGKRSKVNLQNLPAGFLHFAGQTAGEAQDRPNKFTQMLTDRWGVLIATKVRNKPTGAKAFTMADSIVKQLDSTLCGFTPDTASSALRKSRNAGRLIDWANGLYFYVAYYEADRLFCKQ